MQWIWTDSNTGKVNTYAEFIHVFFYSGGKAELKLSASDEYAVFVDGSFIDCGQYDDYPDYKFYDTLDIASRCREGENTLLIRVYYQGADSAQCIAGGAKLWYQLETETEVLESGSQTLCRRVDAYRSGPCEILSHQMSYTFHYDARREGEGDWQPAAQLQCSPVLLPRPIKKLLLA